MSIKESKFPSNDGPWRKSFRGIALIAVSTDEKFGKFYLVDIELEP